TFERGRLTGLSRPIAIVGSGVGGRECDENVSGSVALDCTEAAQAHRGAPCPSLTLLSRQRRIGVNDYNDRAAMILVWAVGDGEKLRVTQRGDIAVYLLRRRH